MRYKSVQVEDLDGAVYALNKAGIRYKLPSSKRKHAISNDVEALHRALKIAKSVVSNKSVFLAQRAIRLDPVGNMSCSDGDTTLMIECPWEGSQEATFVYSDFVQLVKEATQYVRWDGKLLDVDGACFSIEQLQIDNWPTHPRRDYKDLWTVDTQVLNEVLGNIGYACGGSAYNYRTDIQHMYIQRKHLKGPREKTTFVCTDGHRLALNHRDVTPPLENILLHKSFFPILRELEGNLRVMAQEDYLFLDNPQVTTWRRITDSKFPDYEQIISNEQFDYSASGLTEDFLAALKLANNAAKVEKEDGIILSLEPPELFVQVRGFRRKVAWHVQSCKDEPLKIGADIDYLTELLCHSEKGSTLEFKDATTPIRVQTENSLAILMPKHL